MSIDAYKAVWATNFTGGLKLTLLAMAEYASIHNGYTCEASIETLADMVGTKPRQMKRNVAQLAEEKVITIEYGGGRHNTNKYDLSRIINSVIQDQNSVIQDTVTEEETVSSETKTVSSETENSVMDDTRTINISNKIIIKSFEQKTGITSPDESSPFYLTNWADPIERMLSQVNYAGELAGLIDRAIDILWRGGYRVTSPKSVEVTVLNELKRETVVFPNGNGAKSAWQSVKIAVGQPGRPNLDSVTLRAVGMMPGGWNRIKSYNISFIDQLQQEFEAAYERAKNITSPA